MFLALGLFFHTSTVFAENNLEKSKQVIILGDSIFALSGEIRKELAQLSSLDIESYARNGALMKNIVKQYGKARKNLSARTIIMNGGGNDVLANLRECQELSDKCKEAIDEAIDHGYEVVDKMEADGIDNIVYLGYYYTKVLGNGLNDANDYAMEKIITFCQSISIDCHVVDTRKRLRMRGYRKLDGIHPTDRASRIMARMIWDTMVKNDIEQ